MIAEEERDRDPQHLGDAREASGADPVGAFFVFLHLLERNSETAAQVGLGQSPHQSLRADTATDLHIPCVGSLGSRFALHFWQRPCPVRLGPHIRWFVFADRWYRTALGQTMC